MLAFIYSITGFLVAIGILTTIHEFGHFWVARRCGVKVLRFSVGFGAPLFSWHDKLGTEYVIAWLPLGGYVKMLDESEGIVAEHELGQAFNRKPILQKMLVICAGPVFNMLFAVVCYWLAFMLGISYVAPIIGSVQADSAAYKAGLSSGQEIVAIDNQKNPTWEDISIALMKNLGNNNSILLEAYHRESKQYTQHVAALKDWDVDSSTNIISFFGIEAFDPIPPIVGAVVDDYPAQQAGIISGDQIISIDNTVVATRAQLGTMLKTRANIPTTITIKRSGKLLDVKLTPVSKVLDDGLEIGFIGIEYKILPLPAEFISKKKLNLLQALIAGINKTTEYTSLTLEFLYKMLTAQVSIKHIAGPISIAKFAGQTVSSGLNQFLGFMALISISLGILNMLPIPILDGGQFLYCVLELIKGSPLSAKFQEYGNIFGFVFLTVLMLLAIYNDISRLLH